MNYFLGGHSTFFGFINTFVHIIMYTYYMLSAIGPHMQKYLWWKKYLTTLQMVQFVAIMVHAFQLLLTECNYPRAFVWWIGMHAVMFFFLFKQFYIDTYSRRRAKASQKNGTIQNGNSKVEPHQNGVHLNKVNEYFVNGTTDSKLNHRLKTQWYSGSLIYYLIARSELFT